jgi:4-alpha-glucanotransferase
MFGNHDTPSLWGLLEQWRSDGQLAVRAGYAAARLEPAPGERESFRARLIAEPGLLAHAEIAQLFASPAANVSIFFADLFGLRETYNRPGTVGPENWSLRLPPDWHDEYAARLRTDRALNVPLALWLALRARPGGTPRELVRALRDEAEQLREGPPLP